MPLYTTAEGDEIPVLYASKAPDVVSVDAEGNLLALAKGTANLAVYINGVSFPCKVTVRDADTGKRDFTGSAPISLVPMQSVMVKVPGFKAAQAVWSSTNEAAAAGSLEKGVIFEDGVVRITKSGKLTAIGAGQSTLTAVGGGAALTFSVTVSDPVTKTLHMNLGTTKKLNIYNAKKLNWTASNSSIVTIKGNSLKGDQAGETELTAECEGFTYRVKVYVEDPSLTTPELTGKFPSYKLTVKAGDTLTLAEKQVAQTVLFRSAKNDIVFVDEAGKLTARRNGKTRVTAKVNGKQISIAVTVQ
jgi:hypothetical protein